MIILRVTLAYSYLSLLFFLKLFKIILTFSKFEWNTIYALIIILPVLIISFVMQKYMRSHQLAGALHG